MTSCVPWPIPAERTPEVWATWLRWPSALPLASSSAVSVKCRCQMFQSFHRFNSKNLFPPFLCVILPEGAPSLKRVHTCPPPPSSGTPHRSTARNSGAAMETSSSCRTTCCLCRRCWRPTVATSAGSSWRSSELITGSSLTTRLGLSTGRWGGPKIKLPFLLCETMSNKGQQVAVLLQY